MAPVRYSKTCVIVCTTNHATIWWYISVHVPIEFCANVLQYEQVSVWICLGKLCTQCYALFAICCHVSMPNVPLKMVVWNKSLQWGIGS